MRWTLMVAMLILVAYVINSRFLNESDVVEFLAENPVVTQADNQASIKQEVSIQDKWKVDTAMFFYQSLSLYNYKHAAKYVTEPKIILAMEDGYGRITVKKNSYSVKEIREDSVLMSFSRFCYPDLDRVVYLDQTPAGFRIDVRRSLKDQMANMPTNYVPIRQYCYDFKDQPLQGLVLSREWQPTSVKTDIVTFSSGPKKRIALVTERCEKFPECTFVGDKNHSGFILYIDALDLTGTGGNLGGAEYVHLFNYPDYNQSFYEGSYRVTPLGAGRIRLELSIPEFESTELNGYVEFEI